MATRFEYPAKGGAIAGCRTITKKLRESVHLSNLVCGYLVPTRVYCENCNTKENNQLIDWHSGTIIKVLESYGFTCSIKTERGMKYISLDEFDDYSEESQVYLRDILAYED